MTPTLAQASPWKAAEPGAQFVREHYVNARSHELNRAAAKLREDTAEQLGFAFFEKLSKYDKQRRRKYCLDAYDYLTGVLQSRDLTINFDAADWFDVENHHETYTQMYERAIDPATGGMVLKNRSLNPAEKRAMMDDKATFPQHWMKVPVPAHRGLKPHSTQSGNHILKRMMAGNAIAPGGTDNADGYLRPANGDGFLAKNAKFNPKTKQLFAGLNYGRRPSGATTAYGSSHFVLSEKFKKDAIYFPSDTFKPSISATDQVTYQSLGALYLKAEPLLRMELARACLDGVRLVDSAYSAVLVEAHLFSELRFSTGVESVHIGPGADQTVTANARKFVDKWRIKQLVICG